MPSTMRDCDMNILCFLLMYLYIYIHTILVYSFYFVVYTCIVLNPLSRIKTKKK